MTTVITDEARVMAAELANAELELLGIGTHWYPADFDNSSMGTALARLCARTIERDALLARMQEDMGEIDRITMRMDWGRDDRPNAARQIATIAARYRVETDPLLIEARKLVAARYGTACHSEATLRGDDDGSIAVQNCLIALKRGAELAKTGAA